MRKIEATITYKYEVEVNDDDEIVKEYEDDNELLVDCATYHFGTGLPVIGGGGVKIIDTELIEVVSINVL